MALTATMHGFQIELSDVDRGVYETFELRVARHPSESVPYLVSRVLAYALEWRDGLRFGRGVSGNEPAIEHTDPTGRLLLHLDVGAPAADRLHKASKRAEAVAVYTHRPLDKVMRPLEGQGIHQATDIPFVGLPPSLVDPLGERLLKRNSWSILRNEGVVYVTIDADTFEGTLDQRRLEG